jgi:hypothetical protein
VRVKVPATAIKDVHKAEIRRKAEIRNPKKERINRMNGIEETPRLWWTGLTGWTRIDETEALVDRMNGMRKTREALDLSVLNVHWAHLS